MNAPFRRKELTAAFWSLTAVLLYVFAFLDGPIHGRWSEATYNLVLALWLTERLRDERKAA